MELRTSLIDMRVNYRGFTSFTDRTGASENLVRGSVGEYREIARCTASRQIAPRAFARLPHENNQFHCRTFSQPRSARYTLLAGSPRSVPIRNAVVPNRTAKS